MRIGIPKEEKPKQPLVAAAPDTVRKIRKLGYEVAVERGAGTGASFSDKAYENADACMVDKEDVWSSDIVVCLDAPSQEEVVLMRKGAVLVSRLDPASRSGDIGMFERQGITTLAMDTIPRISRAQSMDVRSSMQNIAGYRAVLEAANHFGRFLNGQVTAAGKVAPAKVYVIGVGVAGLSAIGIAVSMGAQVYATDVRPEVADQVASLGATFVDIPVKQQSDDGYAKALTDDEAALANAVYARQAAESDIVITTAQIPGRPSPLLLGEDAVQGMKPGSVIVDLGASEQGSNCELTVAGRVVKTANDVTIIGHALSSLPAYLPAQASQLYGQNIVNFFKLTTPEKDGKLVLDESDEIVRGITVTLDGELRWPPPPVKVSSAKTSQAIKEGAGAEARSVVDPAEAHQAGMTQCAKVCETEVEPQSSRLSKVWWRLLLGILAVVLVFAAPSAMQPYFIVFALAVIVGFYVIAGVSHSLHTPLMSVTNAISGIIIVGAMLLANSGNPVVAVLSFVAMAIASINIFGGFLVTHRMLSMFQRSSEQL